MSLFQVCLQLPLPPPCKRMGETWRSSQLIANQHGWIHVPCLWPASMNNEQHAWQVRPTKQEPEMQKRHSPVQHLSLRRLVDAAYPGGFNKWYISTPNVASMCRYVPLDMYQMGLWFNHLLQSIHKLQFVKSLREPVIQVPGAWRPMQASKPRNVAYNGLQFCRTWSLQMNERKQNNKFLDLRVRRHETNTHSTFWACSQHLVAHSHHASVNRTGDT